MILDYAALTAYLLCDAYPDDVAAVAAAAMAVLDLDEPTLTLAIPAELTAAATTAPDVLAMLGVLAIEASTTTVPLGVRVYATMVADVPALLARRIG
jgi:NAD/NADP transhydrogenase alpha subunit